MLWCGIGHLSVDALEQHGLGALQLLLDRLTVLGQSRGKFGRQQFLFVAELYGFTVHVGQGINASTKRREFFVKRVSVQVMNATKFIAHVIEGGLVEARLLTFVFAVPRLDVFDCDAT